MIVICVLHRGLAQSGHLIAELVGQRLVSQLEPIFLVRRHALTLSEP